MIFGKKCVDVVLARRWMDDERAQIDRWLAENTPTKPTADDAGMVTTFRKPRRKTNASKISGALAYQRALVRKRGGNKQNLLEV